MSSLFLLALLAATAASVSGMPVADHGTADDKSRILCRRNEMWYECGSCDASCKNLNPACPAICRPGCGCIEGHVRDLSEENRCIPKGECPIIEPGEIHEKNQGMDESRPAELKPDKYRPPKPIPIAINPPMCPENERFYPCGACDGSCSNMQPGCTRHCQEHGSCGCIEGHVRDSEGSRCIHRSKCLRVEPEIVRPPMENVRPPMEEVRPPMENVRPPMEEVRPPMVQVNPPMEEVRPPMKEVRPPMEEMSHPMKDVRPPMKEVRPPMENVRPPMEEVRPPMVQVNPPMEEVRPPMKEIHPPMENVRPPMEEVRPPMVQVNPPMEEVRPPMELHGQSCPENERWIRCGACDGTCTDMQPNCQRHCKGKGSCGCIKGHVRESKGSRCIPQSECQRVAPGVVNPPLEEVRPPMVQVNPPLEDVRPPLADIRPPLEEVRPPLAEVRPPLEEVRPPLADVRPPLEEVRPQPADVRPPLEVVPRCPEKEVWMPCGACDGTCSQMRGMCTKQCRAGGCGCMKDHVREPKGHGCIHVSHCADLNPVFPPQID